MKNLILIFFSFSILLFINCDDSANSGNGDHQNPPPPDNENPPITPSPLPEIPSPALVRPAVSALAPDGPELTAYKRAIRIMKSRPASDPTSWTYQAAIHGSTEQPAQRAWNNCQHQSYFFLSWHRMYLYFFERIVRDASGDPNFAIPYWDYTTDNQRFLPEAFRIPANASNELYVAQRNQGVNDGFELPASATDFSQAFSFDNFTSPANSPLSFGGQRIEESARFGGRNGQIEQVPHNVIHVVVGGWMTDPNLAAQDPIFWLHHANIDRLWNKWLQENPARSNPIDDENWLSERFEFFDENGNLVVMTGRDVVNTAEQLGYRYDDDTELLASNDNSENQTNESTIVNAQPITKKDSIMEPIKKGVLLDQEVNIDISETKTSFPLKLNNKSKTAMSNNLPNAKQQRFVLNLEDITYDKIPTGYYEVYLNLPENLSNPDFESIYYVGSMGFFGHAHDPIHSHHGGGHGKNANFEITKLIGNQMKNGEWDFDNLNLTFYLRGSVIAPKDATEAVLERIKPEGNIKIGKIMVEQFE